MRHSLPLTVQAVALTVLAWRLAAREGTHRLSSRHVTGTLLGVLFLVLAGIALYNLAELARDQARSVPRDVTLLAPVQQPEPGSIKAAIKQITHRNVRDLMIILLAPPLS